MNRTRKGNYYRTRTKLWLQNEGWTVANLERRQRVFTKTGVIFRASDIWGADLIAMNGDEMLFVQVKSNKGDIAKGMKELNAHPYPKNILRWVVWWPERAREPYIEVVQ